MPEQSVQEKVPSSVEAIIRIVLLTNLTLERHVEFLTLPQVGHFVTLDGRDYPIEGMSWAVPRQYTSATALPILLVYVNTSMSVECFDAEAARWELLGFRIVKDGRTPNTSD